MMMLCILFLQLTELLFTCCYACFVTKFPNFKGTSHSPKVLKNKTLFIMVIMLFFFNNQGSRGYAKYNDKEKKPNMVDIILIK